MSYYRAIWDSGVWLWTVIFSSVVAFVAVMVLVQSSKLGERMTTFVVGSIAVMLLCIIACAPRGFIVDHRTLKVRTVAFTLSYDLKDLKDVQTVDSSEVFGAGTIRTFGVGGLFGYYGFYRTQKWGNVRAFVTDRNKLVLVKIGGKVLVLSPEKPDEFTKLLQLGENMK
jgi:amino acid transporter